MNPRNGSSYCIQMPTTGLSPCRQKPLDLHYFKWATKTIRFQNEATIQKMDSYISWLKPTTIRFSTFKVGARRFPVGPSTSFNSSSSVKSFFFISIWTTFFPLATLSEQAFFSSPIASSRPHVSFFAFVSVFASNPAFARNSCVLTQVFQPGRW